MRTERTPRASVFEMRRVLVAGWVGSTNLGDELVLAGVRRLVLDALGTGVRIAAVSVAPTTTRRTHGIAAIDHRRLDLIAAAARSADLVVLGGGGLVQDETSPFNLPYHLSRVWAAQRAGTPWVGLALGVGRLDTRPGRRLATSLRHAVAVTVRDAPSLALLDDLEVPARLAADAVVHLASPEDPPPGVEVEASGRSPRPAAGPPEDVLTVSLRPWSGPGGLLPVSWRHTTGEVEATFVGTVAAALDRTVARTGLPVRFVALQTDRDAQLHAQVAARMSTPTQQVVPGLHDVLAEVGRGRAVIAMRYHAALAATLAGRPSVAIGYSPKVDALAGQLGAGSRALAFTDDDLSRLDDAVVDLLGDEQAATTAVTTARSQLQRDARVNLEVLREVAGTG